MMYRLFIGNVTCLYSCFNTIEWCSRYVKKCSCVHADEVLYVLADLFLSQVVGCWLWVPTSNARLWELRF